MTYEWQQAKQRSGEQLHQGSADCDLPILFQDTLDREPVPDQATHQVQRVQRKTWRVQVMDRDDIIRMAREAGWDLEWGGTTIEQVQNFANLVAAAEREECALVANIVAREIDDTNGTA
ncbi:MAG: hypothetical protein ACK559_22425, partial [bacterium]